MTAKLKDATGWAFRQPTAPHLVAAPPQAHRSAGCAAQPHPAPQMFVAAGFMPARQKRALPFPGPRLLPPEPLADAGLSSRIAAKREAPFRLCTAGTGRDLHHGCPPERTNDA